MKSPPPDLGFLRRRYFGPLLSGLLLLRLAALVIWLAALIPFYPDVTFPEGALVARALDVAHGQSPYHDWRQWPHAFAPYPPLAYYPAGWLIRAAAPHPTPHQAYVIGRTLSFAFLLGIFAMVYLLGRALGLTRLWSLLGVAALSECQVMLEFCTSFRPDAGKTFFALAAVWIMMRFRPGRRVAFGALACLYLSLWFKPTAWAVAALAAAWGWRRWGARRALAGGVVFVAAGLIPLWLLDRHWHGLLLLNIVDSLRNGWTFGVVGAFLRPEFRQLFFQLTMLAGLLAALCAARRAEWGRRRLLFAAVPLSLAVGLAQMLKVGSDINYLFECFCLVVVVAAWWVARLWRGELACPPRLREAVLWGLLIPFLLLDAYDSFSRVRDDFSQLAGNWRQPPILREVAGCPGPVLISNPFVALATPAPTVLDYFHYSVLCDRGAIDPAPLLERVRRREFPMVLISTWVLWLEESGRSTLPLYCKGFLKTLAEHYMRVRTVGGVVIMVPRSG